ncbi:restriction endonuclease subunit S, partial [Kocuria atrinae]|uniref:restriction endonuclease subunit S n=1 Tax=Kocuria atrinae TaxID=592377 RepID=UPI001CB8D45B
MSAPKYPWLNKLPTTWRTSQLGLISKIGTGSADVQDSDAEGAYPFVVRSPKLLRLNQYTHDTEAVLTAGDGNVGQIFHHLAGKFAAHQRVYVIEPSNLVIGRFLYYVMVGHFGFSLQGSTAKSTVESLRRPMLTGFQVPVPPRREQQQIADYLDHETAEIDAFPPLSD